MNIGRKIRNVTSIKVAQHEHCQVSCPAYCPVVAVSDKLSCLWIIRARNVHEDNRDLTKFSWVRNETVKISYDFAAESFSTNYYMESTNKCLSVSLQFVFHLLFCSHYLVGRRHTELLGCARQHPAKTDCGPVDEWRRCRYCCDSLKRSLIPWGERKGVELSSIDTKLELGREKHCRHVKSSCFVLLLLSALNGHRSKTPSGVGYVVVA